MSLAAFWLLLAGLFSPALAAEATGVLAVATPTPGAEVFLDGAMIGTAPLTKYIPVGKHKLRIIADNYDPFVRVVDISADKTSQVNATLLAGPGSIEFTGPSGSVLSLGAQSYTVPIRLPSPGPGAMTWTATAPGFEVSPGQLQLVKGRNYLVELKLESSEGVIAITTRPLGAAVELDGVAIGVTPAKVTGQAPGLHGVKVSLEGYGTAYKEVDTRQGGRGAADVGLLKSGAEVTVQAAPSDATVWFNGVQVGTGALVKVANVGKGRIDITVRQGATTVASGRLDVPESGALTVHQSGNSVAARKPLLQRWAFWAAVGGGAVALGTTATVVAVATQPEPPPAGDVVVTLP